MNDDYEDEENIRIRETSLCPCKSRLCYGQCCMPFHQSRAQPETAEQLMRARYSAYFFRLAGYLVDTTHPDKLEPGLLEDFKKHLPDFKWSFLTVVNASKGGLKDKTGKVEFIAEYYVNGEKHKLHELSRFRRHKGNWKYFDDQG